MVKIDIIESPEAVSLKGILTFKSVPAIKHAIEQWMSEKDILNIDLSDIRYSDSSGLALLTEWLRYARGQNKTVNFIDMPEQMRAIAQVTGLCPILFAGEN